ncbi:MAG: hydroxyacid dehydrogenase [Calditrichaeota bacterium]|nr:hydroxyacid dehydrogenase [Calditrichota bacterium]
MRLLIASSIYPPKVEELKQKHDVICAYNGSEDVLKNAITNRQVLIFRSGVQISAAVMEAGPELELLIRAGSGTDNIDMDYVQQRGLKLIRVPEPGAKAVAEMSFTMMLMLARNLRKADTWLREGKWGKTELTGYLLTGKTLGVIGCGNIGSRVGWMGAAWDMKAIGCVDESDKNADYVSYCAAKGIRLTSFDEVLETADFISIHVPLMDSTRGLIGAKEIAKMKKGSYLVNLARGGVVDEDALYDALVSGHLRGAGTDVHMNEGKNFRSRLTALENVVLTPHIGAQTFDSQMEIGERITQILHEHITEKSSVL